VFDDVITLVDVFFPKFELEGWYYIYFSVLDFF
jgi:hypothetical protein